MTVPVAPLPSGTRGLIYEALGSKGAITDFIAGFGQSLAIDPEHASKTASPTAPWCACAHCPPTPIIIAGLLHMIETGIHNSRQIKREDA